MSVETVLVTAKQRTTRSISSILLFIPAERDIDGQFVDFSLVRQAFAIVGEEIQPVIVWVHGVAEALVGSLNSNERLRHMTVSLVGDSKTLVQNLVYIS